RSMEQQAGQLVQTVAVFRLQDGERPTAAKPAPATADVAAGDDRGPGHAPRPAPAPPSTPTPTPAPPPVPTGAPVAAGGPPGPAGPAADARRRRRRRRMAGVLSGPRTMPDADALHLLDDEEHSPFALHDPQQIGQVLRGLAEARAQIATRLVPGGHACPTALLEVRDDRTLVLDGNRDEAMNQRMAAATRVVCSAQLDLVPIRFRLSTPRRTLHEDYVAFTAPWPAALLRLQRRESYRLPL